MVRRNFDVDHFFGRSAGIDILYAYYVYKEQIRTQLFENSEVTEVIFSLF